MNTKILVVGALMATLTACGGHKEHVKAVDEVAKLEAAAKEKAPKAEPIQFDDHGQPTMGGVGGAKGANAKVATDVATAPTTDTATAQAMGY